MNFFLTMFVLLSLGDMSNQRTNYNLHWYFIPFNEDSLSAAKEIVLYVDREQLKHNE